MLGKKAALVAGGRSLKRGRSQSEEPLSDTPSDADASTERGKDEEEALVTKRLKVQNSARVYQSPVPALDLSVDGDTDAHGFNHTTTLR